MFDTFIKLGDIEGECTDSAHQKWIEVQSFSHGLAQQGQGSISATGGRAAARADFQDFHFTKLMDAATPKIALACAKGTHLPEVKVEICKATGEKQLYMAYILKDVVVTSTSIGGGKGSEEPIENVSLAFAQIEWAYTQLDQAGAVANNINAGWKTWENIEV